MAQHSTPVRTQPARTGRATARAALDSATTTALAAGTMRRRGTRRTVPADAVRRTWKARAVLGCSTASPLAPDCDGRQISRRLRSAGLRSAGLRSAAWELQPAICTHTLGTRDLRPADPQSAPAVPRSATRASATRASATSAPAICAPGTRDRQPATRAPGTGGPMPGCRPGDAWPLVRVHRAVAAVRLVPALTLPCRSSASDLAGGAWGGHGVDGARQPTSRGHALERMEALERHEHDRVRKV